MLIPKVYSTMPTCSLNILLLHGVKVTPCMSAIHPEHLPADHNIFYMCHFGITQKLHPYMFYS